MAFLQNILCEFEVFEIGQFKLVGMWKTSVMMGLAIKHHSLGRHSSTFNSIIMTFKNVHFLSDTMKCLGADCAIFCIDYNAFHLLRLASKAEWWVKSLVPLGFDFYLRWEIVYPPLVLKWSWESLIGFGVPYLELLIIY